MRKRKTRRKRKIARRTDPAGATALRDRVRRIAAAFLFSAAVLSSSGLTSAADPAPPPTGSLKAAEDLIASVVFRYASASAYEIDFTQESYWALADSTQVTSGTLTVVPPSLISIRYEDGGGIVANGESLWVYVPATNQFFSARLDSTDLFFDPVRLLSRYAPDTESPFGSAGPSTSGAGGRSAVILRPRPPAIEPVRLDVEIDGAAGLLRGLTAHSSAGDRTRYTLHETRLEAHVPDAAFRLRPPPGAEIVRGTPYGG